MIIETKKGKLPVRYGWAALARFGDMAGLSMDEVLEMDLTKMKVSDMLSFLFVGFQDGARKDGVECELTSIEEVGDLLDDEPDIMEKVMNVFGEMTKAGKGDGKKK